jgi:hypothetical protein
MVKKAKLKKTNGTNGHVTVADKGKGSRTCTVASKLQGDLLLRVFDWIETPEQILGGGSRIVKVGKACPGDVLIKGVSQYRGLGVQRNLNPTFTKRGLVIPTDVDIDLIGGYRLTRNVNKEFFETWLAQNADADMVQNKLIFCFPDKSDAVACAKEHAKTESGFEPLNLAMSPGEPHPDRRVPRPTKNLLGIEAADRK